MDTVSGIETVVDNLLDTPLKSISPEVHSNLRSIKNKGVGLDVEYLARTTTALGVPEKTIGAFSLLLYFGPELNTIDKAIKRNLKSLIGNGGVDKIEELVKTAESYGDEKCYAFRDILEKVCFDTNIKLINDKTIKERDYVTVAKIEKSLESLNKALVDIDKEQVNKNRVVALAMSAMENYSTLGQFRKISNLVDKSYFEDKGIVTFLNEPKQLRIANDVYKSYIQKGSYIKALKICTFMRDEFTYSASEPLNLLLSSLIEKKKPISWIAVLSKFKEISQFPSDGNLERIGTRFKEILDKGNYKIADSLLNALENTSISNDYGIIREHLLKLLESKKYNYIGSMAKELTKLGDAIIDSEFINNKLSTEIKTLLKGGEFKGIAQALAALPLEDEIKENIVSESLEYEYLGVTTKQTTINKINYHIKKITKFYEELNSYVSKDMRKKFKNPVARVSRIKKYESKAAYGLYLDTLIMCAAFSKYNPNGNGFTMRNYARQVSMNCLNYCINNPEDMFKFRVLFKFDKNPSENSDDEYSNDYLYYPESKSKKERKRKEKKTIKKCLTYMTDGIESEMRKHDKESEKYKRLHGLRKDIEEFRIIYDDYHGPIEWLCNQIGWLEGYMRFKNKFKGHHIEKEMPKIININ